MKLHLPKMLLTAVLAVVGIVSSVQADEPTYAYSGTIYTWAGTTSEYHAGPFWTTTYTDGAFTLTENNGSAWQASSQGTNTIRFYSDSTVTSAGIEFGSFSVGGFIVESDAKMDKLFTAAGSGDNVAGGESGRTINIGKAGAYSLSTIEKDFEVKSCGSTITLVGNQRWDITSADEASSTPGATYKINAVAGTSTGGSVTNNGNIIQNGGTVDFNAATISGTGAYTVGSGTLQNATFASGATIGFGTGVILNNVTLSDGSYVAASEAITTTGKRTITKTFDLSGSSNVTIGSVGLNFDGVKTTATSTYADSTLTVSATVYDIAEKGTAALTDIEPKLIRVAGTLTSVNDTNLAASNGVTPTDVIVGTGTVQVDNMLEYGLSALSEFKGTVEVVNGGKIHFGNTTSHLSNIDKIKINSGAYITGHTSDFTHDIELNGGALMVNNGSWLGEIYVAENSSIEVYNPSTIKGNLTAASGKTLAITKPIIFTDTANAAASPTLTITGKDYNADTNECSSDTCGKLDGATLDVQHGTVVIKGRNGGTGMIAGSIKIGAGATLQVSGADTLGYSGQWGGNFTDALTAEGAAGTAGAADKLAKIYFEHTQTLSTHLNLNGYTEVSGQSFSGFGGKVTVNGSNNTIKNEYKNRQAITFEVNGSLTMEGAITNLDDSGALTKSGSGAMTVTGNINTNHEIKVTAGKFNINGSENSLSKLTSTGGETSFGEGTHSVTTLDMASSNSSGTVTLKDKAVVTAGTLNLRSSSTLNLQEGATLKLADGVISIKGTNGNTTKVSADNATYGLSAATFTINNADITINSTADVTVGNRIEGSSLTNDNTGTVTVTNGYNNFSAINANKGNINIQWHDGGHDFQKELNAVTIGAGCVLGVHKTADDITSTANEGTLTIATGGTAKFGEGAQLYSNLELSDGVKLTLDGALTMGSTLKLGEGIVLDKDTLASINALTAGDSPVTLFEGVDSLVLGTAVYTGEVAFSTHFADVNNNDVYLGYDGQNVFAGIQSVPEPTTATLSLLALAGLAARRRRK